MKYMILQLPASMLLEAEVRRYLNDGWHCQGGVFVSDGRFYQAMVFYPVDQ